MYYSCYLVNTMTHHYEFITKTQGGMLHVLKQLKEDFPNRLNVEGAYKLVVVTNPRKHSPNDLITVLNVKTLEEEGHFNAISIATKLGYWIMNIQHNPEQSEAFWRWFNADDSDKIKYIKYFQTFNGRIGECALFEGYPTYTG